jgi:hypothetical protein
VGWLLAAAVIAPTPVMLMTSATRTVAALNIVSTFSEAFSGMARPLVEYRKESFGGPISVVRHLWTGISVLLGGV